MSREDPQFKLRMPEDLRDRLAAAAQANGRSMNAEILARLSASLTNTPEILTTEERLSAQRVIDKMEEVRTDVTQEIEDFRHWMQELRILLPALGPMLNQLGVSADELQRRIDLHREGDAQGSATTTKSRVSLTPATPKPRRTKKK